jgi:hypothetical protein
MHTVVVALLVVTLMALPARADVDPDTGLAVRQEQALQKLAAAMVPNRNYHADCDPGTQTCDRADCQRLHTDTYGLVARLELDRRGLAGGATPAEAAPWAQHIAESMAALIGTGGAQGRCQFTVSGSPSVPIAVGGLGYALHRYGSAWPADVREAIRVTTQEGSWPEPVYVHNASVGIFSGQLLAAEALGDPDFFDFALARFEAVVDRTLRHGGIELNAPLYTAHHIPSLVFMQVLRDARSNALARTLLEYVLLFQAHLYLPGGGLAAPQSRDYSGGAADGGSRALLPALWLLIGDPELTIDLDRAYGVHLAHAASDYVLPEIIRSVFLDKADGYTFWAYTDAQQGSGRTPHAVYNLGLEGARGIPWQTVVTQGGKSLLGVAYGYRASALYVASGAYARAPDGSFAILYQYQPKVTTDTDDLLSLQGGSGLNDDPDDFTGELYDYERMVYGRTAVSLWDPTTRDKPPGVVRTHQDTRVHLPNYDQLGGETTRSGLWRVGRLGDVFIAWAPLGSIAFEESRGGGSYTYLRLDGPSGGTVELATANEFASLSDYAADLADRQPVFTSDPLAAELDARDPQTGGTVHIRLEYRPERRFIDGAEQSVEEALGHGLMSSPWVTWEEPERRLRLERDCYHPVTYDWDDGVVIVDDPPEHCQSQPDGSNDAGPSDDGGAEPGPEGDDGGFNLDATDTDTAGDDGGMSGDDRAADEDVAKVKGCGCDVPGTTFSYRLLLLFVLLPLVGRCLNRRCRTPERA